MTRLTLVFLWGIATPLMASAELVINVDDDFPRKVYEIFTAGNANDDELESIARSAGAQALIKKVQTYAPQADADLLKEALRRTIVGDKQIDDPFYFEHTLRQRQKTQALLSAIVDSGMGERIAARLDPYLPAERDLDIHVDLVLVVGGASAGWTMGDGNFQVGLDHHANDPVEVIDMTAAHEIYHVVQERLMPQREGDSAIAADRVDALLVALMMEGTASLFDELDSIDGDGTLLDYLREKQEANRKRIGSAFLLLETLVLRTASDAEASLGQLYELGFLDTWGSSGYEVGRVMADAIIAVDGTKAIPQLLQAGPREFVRRYVAISKTSDELPRFSSAFTELVSMENSAN